MPVTKTEVIDDKFFENKEFQEALDSFADMRRKKRCPMTSRALKLILKKLHKISEENVETAIEILDQSNVKGWQDIYPLIEENRSISSQFTNNKPEETSRRREEI